MKNNNPSKGNTNTYVKEQAKQLKRIKQFIKSAEKRGYLIFDEKPSKSGKMRAGFDKYEAPKPVKNPTPITIERLKKITPDYLYERALWVDPESGAVQQGKEGRRIERSRAAIKGVRTRRANRIPPPSVNLNLAILDSIREHIERIQTLSGGKPDLTEYKNRMGNYMIDMYDDIIASTEMSGDLYEYANYLESRASEIHNILDDIMIASDRTDVDVNITSFMAIINRGSLSQEQVDSLTDYTEAMGYGGGNF